MSIHSGRGRRRRIGLANGVLSPEELGEFDSILEDREEPSVSNMPPLRLSSEGQSSGDTETPTPVASETALGRLLHGIQDLTWVFVGDHGQSPDSGRRDGQSAAEQIFDGAREQWARSTDIFIDATSPRATLKEIRRKLFERVARFQPQLVFLMLGLDDSRSGMRKLPAFEADLTEIIETLLSCRAVPILNTPPHSPWAEKERLVDQMVYVEAIRATATEFDIPLIDHWDHWEWAAAQVGEISAWMEKDSLTNQGRRQIAKFALNRLIKLAE